MRAIDCSCMLLSGLTLLVMCGCSSARSPQGPQPPGLPPAPGSDPAKGQPTGVETGPPLPGGSSINARIVRRAKLLLNRPYRWGGSDPSGFDCSGFTAHVFAAAGIRLPRTTVEQAKAGRWVAPDELRTGDLVFFGAERDEPFHVGLVISEPGRPLTMIHSSTSRGVIETELVSDSYWLPRLSFGRRVSEP